MKFPGTGSQASTTCFLPQTGQLDRQERTPHSLGATSKQEAVQDVGCGAKQEAGEPDPLLRSITLTKCCRQRLQVLQCPSEKRTLSVQSSPTASRTRRHN
ncbi:hypothetical protein AV530_013369 [Patagioenas fasciata monilis]|uniref:Uncharacterized protein n=1 Tax=Patagioenas fasciata monilis TaxID=372326 RepID=A0A1V4JP87_PATFA|nr:hypothetical protein AV530_013369 [Patagioenas fasciata monilis]